MADQDKLNTQGREANAAQPVDAAPDNRGAERYPPVRQDDAVEPPSERRSFDPATRRPAPRQGTGDSSPAAAQEGYIGPGGDPAEGKR